MLYKHRNLLTRDQAIAIVGEAAIDAVDATQHELTAGTYEDDEVEFSAWLDGVTVYRRFDRELVEATFDLSDLDWDEPEGYKVEID